MEKTAESLLFAVNNNEDKQVTATGGERETNWREVKMRKIV